jgi:hypothetical protein
MATLYSYPLGTPLRSDLIIGTKLSLSTNDNLPITQNYSIGSLLDLISGAGGVQDLQQVTNVRKVGDVSISTNNVKFSGQFLDSAGTVGSDGQVLTSNATGNLIWSADGGGTVTSVATTFSGDAVAFGGSPITGAGTLAYSWSGDATHYINGAGNKVLLSTLPQGVITSLTTTGTSGASTLTSGVLNIPTPTVADFTSLTTLGSSGASTLTSGVLNIPDYATTNDNTTYTLASAETTTISLTSASPTGAAGAVELAGAGGTTIVGTGDVITITSPAVPFTSLTTTGSTGASTLTSGVLNIPNYATGGAVTSIVAGTNVTISGSTGDVTVNATVPITSLTTNGTSGASTLTSGVLNIPSYTSGGGVVTSLTTTGTSGDAATLSAGVLNIPTPVIPFTSLTTTGSGVATLTTGVLNIPNNTYTEIDTLQTVTARGASSSIATNFTGSLTVDGSNAGAYFYVGGNAQATAPPLTYDTGMAMVWNNSGGSRENEMYYATGAGATQSDNDNSYFAFINRFNTAGTPVDTTTMKLYGSGLLELAGPTATATIRNSHWRMPTTAAPNTGYVLAKASGSINLEWVANGSTSTVVTNSFTASQIISGGTIAFNTLSVPVGKQLLVENVVFYLDYGGTAFNYPSGVTINLQYNDGFSITTISTSNTNTFMNSTTDRMAMGVLPLSASYPYVLGGVVITNPGDMEIVLPSGVSVGDGVLRVSIKYQELNTGASFSL